jgi:O-antigen ligase
MKMTDPISRASERPRGGTGAEMPGKIEYAFHVLACILMMGAFSPVFRNLFGVQAGSLEGDPFQRTLLTAAYLLALPALCFHYKRALSVMAVTPVVWLLLLWATLSVLWSGFPDVAFRRVLALWLTTLYGLVLYLRFGFKPLLRLLGGALAVVLAGSLVLLVIFPEWAVMGPPLLGKWRGVFVHKNHLGRFSVLALLVAVYLFRASRKRVGKMAAAALILVGVLTLVGSQSLSALLIAGLMLLSALFFKILVSQNKLALLWLVVFLIAAGIAVFLFARNYELILSDGLDKDASLSGRLPLWQGLAEKISQRPLLGYGYGSFWLGTEGPAAEIWKKLSWEAAHAHNGYLDLWLHLGFPGICLGFFLLLRSFILGVKHFFVGGPAGRFWALFLVYIIGYNMVESVFVTANNLFWVLIVYGYVYLEDQRRGPALVGASGARPAGGM